MIRYNISAYVNHTYSWGEPSQQAVIAIDESVKGDWVKFGDVEKYIRAEHYHLTEISELRAQLDRANAMIALFMENVK